MMNSNSRWGGRGRAAVVASAAVLALVACGELRARPSSGLVGVRGRARRRGGDIKIGVLTTCGGPFATFEARVAVRAPSTP